MNLSKLNQNEIKISKKKTFVISKIKRQNVWTVEEDEKLLDLALQHMKRWMIISSYFKNKSPIQCSARYKRICPGIKRGGFTPQEDEMIVNLINEHGKNWGKISSIVKNRNGKQIRDRYINHLNPALNKGKFTEEEDNRIIFLYLKHGPSWKKISESLENRTGDMVKNRFYSHLEKSLCGRTKKSETRRYFFQKSNNCLNKTKKISGKNLNNIRKSSNKSVSKFLRKPFRRSTLISTTTKDTLLEKKYDFSISENSLFNNSERENDDIELFFSQEKSNDFKDDLIASFIQEDAIKSHNPEIEVFYK